MSAWDYSIPVSHSLDKAQPSHFLPCFFPPTVFFMTCLRIAVSVLTLENDCFSQAIDIPPSRGQGNEISGEGGSAFSFWFKI